MPNMQTRCASCGATVTLELPAGLEDVAVIGATCERCADQQVEERGGVVLALAQTPETGLFPLGKITVTGGAVEALAESGQHAAEFIGRHVRGDWGACGRADAVSVTDDQVRAGPLVTENDAKMNKIAMLSGSGRIMSVYVTAKGERVWVMTDLWQPGMVETTCLLPDEY
jgi:hypothetical protein